MSQLVGGPCDQLPAKKAVSHRTREESSAAQRLQQSDSRAVVGRDTSNTFHGLSYRLEALYGSRFFRIPHS